MLKKRDILYVATLNQLIGDLSMRHLVQRTEKMKKVIKDCEYLVIGGGAGLSSAAGITYSGKRFDDNFQDFQRKYKLKDMYTATFYPFLTEEEFWAHWARHIFVNYYNLPTTKLYEEVRKLVNKKNYFVITTNVDGQFMKSGFDENRIFEVQGTYHNIQCANACHDALYDNEKLIREMVRTTKDCTIPKQLVPKCPVCGGKMDINVRYNEHFVQDKAWYKAYDRYQEFLQESKGKHTVYLEMGVGFSTPGIIRYSFEQLVHENINATLIRFNRDFPKGDPVNKDKTICFNENIFEVIKEMNDFAADG